VENLELIRSEYEGDKRVAELCSHLEVIDSAKIRLDGVAGASYAMIVLAAAQNLRGIHILIEDDKEAAAYLYNTLQSLGNPHQILFLPDSMKRSGRYDQIDNHNMQLRTETLSHIIDLPRAAIIIVSYPEAAMERFVDPRSIREEKIKITQGEGLDTDTMFEVLMDLGFERVDFVYEPGQFSVRGGIIDIFSHGNEWPYRLELFDDEVESIREFEPLSQLSRRTLSYVSIIPNVKHIKKDNEQIHLLTALPESAMIWIHHEELLLAAMDKTGPLLEKAKADLPETDVGSELEVLKDLEYITSDTMLDGLSKRSVVSHGSFENLSETHRVEMGIKPHSSFNKNLKLLIQEMEEHQKSGVRNFLFTENARQVERFHRIFHDLNADVKFEPVMKGVHAGYIDESLGIAIYTDHQIFNRFHKYQLRRGYTKDQAMQVKMLRELKPGDFVTHIDHGIGKYSGLEKIEIGGKTQESVRLLYKNNDLLYVSINSLHKISKYSGKDGTPPSMNKLGGDAWKALKRKTKRKVKDIAKELIELYAKRKAAEGFAHAPDGYLQNELEASFIYEDTPDQYATTQSVKEDMMKPHPMDRLICGDVGFGKTEIAVRAAFKAVVSGKQVAILVPTTILALQHQKTFVGRLGEFGTRIDYLNRFRSTAEKKAIYEKLKTGELDIVIGTHALLNKAVEFKDLGLLVIDEEQKFGVAAKDKLKRLKVNVDTLTLTATPIPRTLQFSLMSARDLSIIKTAPPNRQPIHTERRVFNDELIRDSIYYEFARGGQVFFVHNRVKTLPDIAAMVKRICPDVTVAVAHGQMDVKKLEETLVGFIEGKFDVLVSTNIIETGLDISNANTIIINNAHQYGLSDLHQLRGRVGRSNRKAFCYLFSPPLSVLTPEARKRIQTIEDFSDLGSGFHIAMKDLDIRGAGNLLGGEQSGFISDIGFETYQKILDEAIQELKDTEFKDLFDENEVDREYVHDVDIEADIEMLIPDEYVNIIQERLLLYSELDHLESEDELEAFAKNLQDRFGPIPEETLQLFDGLRLRWKCKKIGFERLILKNGVLKGFFLRNSQSAFYESKYFQSLMKEVATDTEKKWALKQTPRFLSLSRAHVKDISEALVLLSELHTSAQRKSAPQAQSEVI